MEENELSTNSCGKMRFLTKSKIRFVALSYFSIRANINTACEKNSTSAWHLETAKERLSYLRSRLYTKGHRLHTFMPIMYIYISIYK